MESRWTNACLSAVVELLDLEMICDTPRSNVQSQEKTLDTGVFKTMSNILWRSFFSKIEAEILEQI